MATADQIKALIKSHLESDDDRFMTTAMRLAAHEARAGHGQLAQEIRKLVDNARARGRETSRPIPIAVPRGELAGLLAVSYPDTRLSEMVLSNEIRKRLKRLLHEQTARARLQEYGLSPRRKVLLVGPPGSGKTMTASALAGELKLPLYVIVLDGLITKFMGETAAKLRLIFNALAEHRGVYLFDEFDAIGRKRDGSHDVGEIRRVLNSFLQFLEQDNSSSIIVAATNHPDILDRALFRRFDDVIQYDFPPPERVREVIENRLATFDADELDWGDVLSSASGLSYAEIVRACDDAAKCAILSNAMKISSEGMLAALLERRAAHELNAYGE